jgi:hypothetical protein
MRHQVHTGHENRRPWPQVFYFQRAPALFIAARSSGLLLLTITQCQAQSHYFFEPDNAGRIYDP